MVKNKYLIAIYVLFLVFCCFLYFSRLIDLKKRDRVSSLFLPIKNDISGHWVNEYNDNIYLFKDSTFTAIVKDSLILGTFNKENRKIKFKLYNSNLIEKEFYYSDEALSIDIDDHYFEYKKVNNLIQKNPFHYNYQHWRKKSLLNQTDTEIKKKVLNYLNFLKFKFDWAIKNSLDEIPNDKLSPINFSPNGIWFTDKSLNNWRNIFRNKENFDLANQILINNLPKNYKFNNKLNQFENFKNIIELYIENIQK